MRHANQGSNWIRRSTRLAVYTRDDHRCVYCQRKVRAGRGTNGSWAAHLDHVVPCELGGSSRPENLVTACRECNDAKRELPLRAFLKTLAGRGVDVAAVAGRVRAALAVGLTPALRAAGRAAAAKEDAKHGVLPNRKPRAKKPTAKTTK